MVWSFSRLDEEKMKAITELEEKLNVVLLAFSGQNLESAKLTEDELKQIKDLEKELDLSLVAVKEK